MAVGAAVVTALVAVLLLRSRTPEPVSAVASEEQHPERKRAAEISGRDEESSERQARAAWASGMMQKIGELAGKRREKLAARLSLTTTQQNQLQKGMQASMARVKGQLDECAAAGEMKNLGILLYETPLRVGEPGEVLRPLLSAEQLQAYEKLVAAENKSRQESAASRELARLLTVLDDITPEQREAVYQTFIDHGNPGQPDIFDERFFQQLPEVYQGTPTLEELSAVLTQEQFQRYSEKMAMWR